MAGAEVEDPPGAALPGHAGAEHLAALEPGDQHGLHRLGHEEGLAVHLLLGELDPVGQAREDRVAAVDRPEPLALAGLAPAQGAGSPHQADEGLGEMPGVEDDQAHALVDPGDHPLDDAVVDLAVGLVAPPDQHVGGVEPVLGQAVLGLVEGRGRDLDAVAGQGGRDGGVDAVGVDGPDHGVLALVDELVPDDGADHGGLPAGDPLGVR